MVDEDNFSEILYRLPATDVLRFRCLSKSHMGLITSSDFAKRQCICNRSSLSSDVSVVVTRSETSYRMNRIYSPAVITRTAANFRITIDADKSCTNAAALIDSEKYLVVGCCRGVVCLRHVDDREKITFWNPLTGHSRSCVDDVDGPNPRYHYYFGHDLIADEFKLLRISEDSDDSTQIYRSKTGSWHKITARSEIPLVLSSDVFVDVANATHFFAKTYASIVAFDFASEAFNVVPLPESGRIMSGLSSLDGNLCFLSNDVEEDVSDVWVMKESWVKLFSFGLSIAQFVSNGNLVPLRFRGGEMVLLCTCFLDGDRKHRLYAYNVGERKLKKLHCGLHTHTFDHANYTGKPSDQKSCLFKPTLFRP